MADEDDEIDIVTQTEELEALSAIYGDDICVVDEINKIIDIRINTETDQWWSATIQVLLPPNYPSKVPPVFQVFSECLTDADLFEISNTLHNLWRENEGQSILYTWVEHLREFLFHKYETQPEVSEESTKESTLVYHEKKVQDQEKSNLNHDIDDTSGDEASDEQKYESQISSKLILESKFQDEVPEILSGEPITDRRSTFQAHTAHVVSEKQVKQVMDKLKENSKVARASHNIMAYRIESTSSDLFLQDHDDDGEDHAGGRLLHLLQILKVKNIIIIVSRWYGGILLGPDRFKHINNCARDLIASLGLLDLDKSDKKVKSKSKVNKKKS